MMSKLWPTIIALLGAVAANFSGDILVWLADHPQLTANLAAATTIIANFVQSPKSTPPAS